MTTKGPWFKTLSNASLAAELDRLGITWVVTSKNDLPHPHPTAQSFLAALASSDEARLRLALIPLCLARPDYAQAVTEAARLLTDQAHITLICYYTAAALLRQKFATQLASLGLEQDTLHDLFGRELGLPESLDPDEKLKRLAERQSELSGRALNWYGTYDHAAKRFLKRAELELAWTAN